ncbi:hypothetical protein Ae201684_016910 [Aphanomyces euteiches]|uniref:Uncharacterized protein n=1 Tax=Aphanomyces euteiches TaxID=100861 RepID=A0A6G0WAU8_9STRA|nr:hypothetical protein Ae201684_016910 [Aphanomyces euteiches]
MDSIHALKSVWNARFSQCHDRKFLGSSHLCLNTSVEKLPHVSDNKINKATLLCSLGNIRDTRISHSQCPPPPACVKAVHTFGLSLPTTNVSAKQLLERKTKFTVFTQQRAYKEHYSTRRRPKCTQFYALLPELACESNLADTCNMTVPFDNAHLITESYVQAAKNVMIFPSWRVEYLMVRAIEEIVSAMPFDPS